MYSIIHKSFLGQVCIMISIIVFLTILLILTSFFCIKFALILINIQEVLEESLDIIDEKYRNLSKILKTPIFYNSPEVKSTIQEIEETKDALLYIANQLTSSSNLIEDKKEENFE